METKLVQCANCGAEIDLLTQQCPLCASQAAAPEPTPLPPPASAFMPPVEEPTATVEATETPGTPAAASVAPSAVIAESVAVAPPPAPVPAAEPVFELVGPDAPAAALPPASAFLPPAEAPTATTVPTESPGGPAAAAVAPAAAIAESVAVTPLPAPATDPVLELVAPEAPAAALPSTPAPEAPEAASPAVAAPPAAGAVAGPAPQAASASDKDRALGLLLFEAEEALARGAPDKAIVLASRAVKERPDSLTGRALMERARRELLRGRRREKLEARIAEAQGLFDHRDFEGAERLISKALKLLPDHAAALQLFGRLRDRRLAAGTAEAEAERELQRLAQARAQKALEAARAALAQGWERKALLTLRSGLRDVPDHPELLSLLRELVDQAEDLDVERARKRALHDQVRAGLEMLEKGELNESLRTLRAVLREDPESARAQAAVHEVRNAWLQRAVAQRRPAPVVIAPPVPPPRAAAAARPAPSAPRPTPGAPRPTAASRPERAAARPAVPAEILLPRTRRRSTPLALILVCAIALLSVAGYLVLGRAPAPEARPAPPTAPTNQAAAQTPVAPAEPPVTAAAEETGPLRGLEPALRQAIERTLAAYARALESADAERLAAARPDLGKAERDRLVARFAGALNAATDLRVLDVVVKGDEASVPILRTDVIVGGKSEPGAPVEEKLRFVRRGGAWLLRP